ncbi:MAG: hypothetical protein QXG91_02495 [Candidatus Aenigmatarchaeota archaeon]
MNNKIKIERELITKIKEYLEWAIKNYLYLENLQTFEYKKLYEGWEEWNRIRSRKNFKEFLRKLLEEKEINIRFLYPETYKDIEEVKNCFESLLEKTFKNYEIFISSKKYIGLNIPLENLDEGCFYVVLTFPPNSCNKIYGKYLGNFAYVFFTEENIIDKEHLCKTAIHEFLHTLFPHCSEPECIMVYDASIYSNYPDLILGERCKLILELYRNAKVENDKIVFDLNRKDKEFEKRCDEDFEKHIKKVFDIAKNKVAKKIEQNMEEELYEDFILRTIGLNKIKFGYDDIGYIAEINKYNISSKSYGNWNF